ncbi:DNA-binding protein [Geobacter sp. DSM 9736]|uniref:DNA-binding protein n=1 Tax=Geobacter sp. DSM 9736 TaxID=1277350 RepID=UPI000B50A528|nr:DNA-binding protein [Geobacter sp. DSM 9736]SNB47409.1 hypothetical protein SAMN06269301_2898 [Geobacter sp. DSM 9736]
MKWQSQWLTLASMLLLPAAGYCFAGYSAKPPREAAPAVSPEAAAASEAQPKADNEEKRPTHVGKVLETMHGGEYTYIKLEKANGETKWFAVPVAEVKVGDQVELMQGMEMGQFKSKALNRTFESINFSGGVIVKEDDETIKKKAHKGIVADAAKDGASAEPIKVERATGADSYTIAEVFQKKGELAGRKVVVRGKVVKVSEGIMGKNWVHLRDGSGDAAKGTHNLIATTQEVPAVGDTITLKGDFFRDKDFGSGYLYDVIVENATFTK